MSDLSDKLKALGVNIGPDHLSNQKKPGKYSLDRILSGDVRFTPFGETYVVESHYPAGYRHGPYSLLEDPPRQALANWAQDQRVALGDLDSFAFIDTETTGLSGGAGTYAFLIGVGRIVEGGFLLEQFFLRDPSEEPAQLAELESFLAHCQTLVSFNGKAFDIPLLVTRFISQGVKPPFSEFAHLDLLHLSRRLWRYRLSNRALGSLEVHILGTQRTQEDVPGWMIPQMYFDYLHSGDPEPLKKVFYHNAMDILSLAALFIHTSQLLADPLNANLEHSVDMIALARLYEDSGNLDMAEQLYRHGLEHAHHHTDEMPEEVYLTAIMNLARLYKRQTEWDKACNLWELAADHREIEAHIELAKYYEHQRKEYQPAIRWTAAAKEIVLSATNNPLLSSRWIGEIDHRLNRLNRKLEKE
jgi:uncharacterized protein YprB with RNaseH-like and TPR domain